MNRRSTAVIPLLVAAGAAFAGTRWDLDIGTRHAVIYAPDKRDKPALVISMHGIGGGSWWTTGAMQYEALADTANFVVAYPDGENSQWDLGGEKDVNFVLSIIDEMSRKYDIDRDRVYASGFSMGGMMSWYLSCRIPDKIAAIVPGDGYPLYGMSGCSEVRHVPVLHIHGTADDFVSYSGLVGSFLPSQVSRYGCPTAAVRTRPFPEGVDGRNASQLAQPTKSFLDTWGPCSKDGLTSEIQLISVDGMIHDWATPNKANGSDDPNYKGKPFDVNGTWEAWNFMRQWSLKGKIGGTPFVPAHRDSVFNGAFDLGPKGWTFNVWGGGAQGSVVDGEYVVRVDSVGTHNSDIQVVQNGIVLVQGKSYEVTFDARASAPRTLEANVEKDASPWTSYLPQLRNFDLTPTRKTFSYVFTMTEPTDSNGRISFNAGSSTESVFLDEISIRMVDAPSGIRGPRGSAGLPAQVRIEGSTLRVGFRASPGAWVSLGVYDPGGRRMRSASFRSGQTEEGSWIVDLAGMPAGPYLLGIDVDGAPFHRSRFLLGNRGGKASSIPASPTGKP